MNASGTNPLPDNFTALSPIASHIPQPQEAARVPAGRRAPGAHADLWVKGPSRGGALSGAAASGRAARLSRRTAGAAGWVWVVVAPRAPRLLAPPPAAGFVVCAAGVGGQENPHRDRHQHRRCLTLRPSLAVPPVPSGGGLARSFDPTRRFRPPWRHAPLRGARPSR